MNKLDKIKMFKRSMSFFKRKNLRVLALATGLVLFSACSTMDFLKYDKEELLRQNKEFDKQVVIQEAPESTSVANSTSTSHDPTAAASAHATTSTTITSPAITDRPALVASIDVTASPSKNKKVPTPKKSKATEKKSAAVAKSQVKTEVKPTTRQPDMEDSVGFTGATRTPDVNPFRVGEKVVHAVRYFSAEAGTLNLEVRPHVVVNGRKSYNFYIGLKTSSLFSKFYSVDDTVQTYLDYEDMVPYVFKINVRESGKLAQAHSYFDQNTLKANFWEKKYTEKNGEEETKKAWDILPFSQNAFSGIFYMRIFEWKIGKEYSFRVSDDEKNVVFKGTALAKEKIQTDAGAFNAIKIRANILSRGALTQVGDLLLWISDDDRKFILRIEAKIKIGTLVSEVTKIEKGSP